MLFLSDSMNKKKERTKEQLRKTWQKRNYRDPTQMTVMMKILRYQCTDFIYHQLIVLCLLCPWEHYSNSFPNNLCRGGEEAWRA